MAEDFRFQSKVEETKKREIPYFHGNGDTFFFWVLVNYWADINVKVAIPKSVNLESKNSQRFFPHGILTGQCRLNHHMYSTVVHIRSGRNMHILHGRE
jgi:hypothetical protein